MKKIFIFLFFCNIYYGIFAEEIQKEYRSAHFLGMGDAGIANATGVDALFYNPAGIYNSKWLVSEGVLVSPMVSFSANAKDLYSKITNNSGDMMNLVSSLANKPLHFSVQNYTGLIFKKAALGTMQRIQTDVFLGTDPDTGLLVAKLSAVARTNLELAFARSFFNDDLLIGIRGKFGQKAETNMKVSALEAESVFKNKSTSTLMKEYIKRGNGLGADVGFLWKINTDVQPKLGLVVRNIGNTNYGFSVPADYKSPSIDKQQIDLGFSVSPGTKRSRALFALDIRDLLNKDEIIYKRIHLGGELSFENIVGFNVGFNQGYPSYGGFINLRILKLEFGMYSEELEKYPGDLRSQRIYTRLSIGWTP